MDITSYFAFPHIFFHHFAIWFVPSCQVRRFKLFLPSTNSHHHTWCFLWNCTTCAFYSEAASPDCGYYGYIPLWCPVSKPFSQVRGVSTCLSYIIECILTRFPFHWNCKIYDAYFEMASMEYGYHALTLISTLLFPPLCHMVCSFRIDSNKFYCFNTFLSSSRFSTCPSYIRKSSLNSFPSPQWMLPLKLYDTPYFLRQLLPNVDITPLLAFPFIFFLGLELHREW